MIRIPKPGEHVAHDSPSLAQVAQFYPLQAKHESVPPAEN